MKFHEFVKLAAWSHPIAIIPHRSLNTINSISSMATYFGLDLEIVRNSDLTPQAITTTSPEEEHLLLVESNLQDYSLAANLEGYAKDASVYTRLEDLPTTLSDDPNQQVIFGSACMAKVNVQNAMLRKERLVREHEPSLSPCENPLRLVERAAK